MVSGFHHIAMRVHDFDASVDFYTRVLKCPKGPAWSTPNGRAIMIEVGDGSYLELFEGAESGAEAVPASRPVLHFALRVSDTQSVLETVRSAGAEITTETKDVDIPSDPVYPVRIAFFKGPDGEIVELFQER